MSSTTLNRDAAKNLSEEFVKKIRSQDHGSHYTVGYLTAMLENLMVDVPGVSDRVVDHMSFIEEPAES